MSFVLGEGVGLSCSNDCSIYVYNIYVWTDGRCVCSEVRGTGVQISISSLSKGTEKRTGLLALAQGKVGMVTKAMYQNQRGRWGRAKGFIWLSWLEYMVWVGYMVYGIG